MYRNPLSVMGYEDAKSTKLLATHCCVCNRPLRDANSVELGIGPVCRQRYGYELDVTEAARAKANQLVHAIACAQDMTSAQHAELVALGYTQLAEKLADRLMQRETVTIEEADGEYIVNAPYREELVTAWRSVGRWDWDTKTRRVKANQKGALWSFLKKHYDGCLLKSDKGETVIGAPAPKPEPETVITEPLPPKNVAEEAPKRALAKEEPQQKLDLGEPPRCNTSRCVGGWYYWNGSEYPCGTCSERGKWEREQAEKKAEIARQEDAREKRKADMEEHNAPDCYVCDEPAVDALELVNNRTGNVWHRCQDCPPEPTPDSFAATARFMAANDESGEDWDAWKDYAKENY